MYAIRTVDHAKSMLVYTGQMGLSGNEGKCNGTDEVKQVVVGVNVLF